MTIYPIDPTDKELLINLYDSYYPVGSGPLSSGRMICCLIESIAKQNGWIDELKQRSVMHQKIVEKK